MRELLKAAVLPGVRWWRKLPVGAGFFRQAQARLMLVPWTGWADVVWLVGASIILNVVSAGSNISKDRGAWAYSTQVAGGWYMSRSLRRLVPLLLPLMESAVTSSAGDSKACMEVALWSPVTLLLCRHTKRMGPAQEGAGRVVVVERGYSSSNGRGSGKPLCCSASLTR